MTIAFRVVETHYISLWDFGWLDSTFFSVENGAQPLCDKEMLGALVRDPIFQRSFCSPGPWGESIGRHGPFLHATMSEEWYQPISHRQLEERIDACLNDARWTKAASKEQLRAVEGWLGQVREEACQVWELAIPDRREVRVEWDFIWSIFQEFASLSKDRKRLQIAVIGYD
jgi:hypothetical protein